MRRIHIETPLLLCLTGLLLSCGGGGSAEEERSLPVVTVDVAAKRDVDQTGTFTGTVEAKVSNNIAPQTPARIGRIYAEVGDRVKKGQKLVEMDGANLAQAKVRMENDKVEFERADELYKIGGTSKSEWDARKLAYDVSRTNYDNLAENTVLVSPVSGVVTARNYDSGDMYSGASPILTVEQIRPVKLKVDVSEVLFTKVDKGMEVEVTTDVYGDRRFKGYVDIVYPTVDPATRTFPIEVRIDNSDEAVRPGMFARVSLTHETARRVVVPDRAVVKQTGSGDKYIYRLRGDRVEFVKVEPGRRIGTLYEILSGVEEGDTVVVTGQTRLNDGAEVEIVDGADEVL